MLQKIKEYKENVLRICGEVFFVNMGKGKKKLDRQKKEHIRQKSRNSQRRRAYSNMSTNGEIGKRQEEKKRARYQESSEAEEGGRNQSYRVTTAHFAGDYIANPCGDNIHIDSREGDTGIVSMRYDVDIGSVAFVSYSNDENENFISSLRDILKSVRAPIDNGLVKEINEIEALISSLKLKNVKGNL